MRPPIRSSASRIVIWAGLNPFSTNRAAAAKPAAPAPMIITDTIVFARKLKSFKINRTSISWLPDSSPRIIKESLKLQRFAVIDEKIPSIVQQGFKKILKDVKINQEYLLKFEKISNLSEPTWLVEFTATIETIRELSTLSRASQILSRLNSVFHPCIDSVKEAVQVQNRFESPPRNQIGYLISRFYSSVPQLGAQKSKKIKQDLTSSLNGERKFGSKNRRSIPTLLQTEIRV